MLVIDRAVVERSEVADVNVAASVVGELLRQKSLGRAVSAPEIPMYPNGTDGGGFYSLPAYLLDDQVAGIKWTSHVRTPRAPGEPPASHTKPLVILNDLSSGEPLAVVDGLLISGVRTAAVSHQFFSRMAAFEPTEVLCCGAGFQARWQCLAALNSLPSLRRLSLWSRRPEQARATADVLRPLAPPGVAVVAVEDLDQGTRQADVVVGATSAEQPYLTAKRLAGCSYVHIGLNDVSEEAIGSFPQIVCDDFEAGAANSRQALFRLHRKDPALQSRVVRLEELIAGAHLEPRAMFNSFGLAIFDVGLACRVYRQAVEKGWGEHVRMHAE